MFPNSPTAAEPTEKEKKASERSQRSQQQGDMKLTILTTTPIFPVQIDSKLLCHSHFRAPKTFFACCPSCWPQFNCRFNSTCKTKSSSNQNISNCASQNTQSKSNSRPILLYLMGVLLD
mmetsp:Transcript_3713/g.8569  ORF Transcript_3713/g.8569 Transcript_3713/m.8569 type:complete len:119 (-) Transcript_3713:287-643(-)